MNIKKICAACVVALVSVLTLFLVIQLRAGAAAQEEKRLTIGHFMDEPVEIVSVNLRGKALDVGGDRFAPTADWPQQLEITIKNVSEKAVSHVVVDLITSGPADSKESIANSEYTFGSHPDKAVAPVFLKPGETAKLVHKASFGKTADPAPAQILIQDVIWDNDDQIIWSAGRILRRVSEKGEPPTYKPIPPSGARYIFPKGYVPSPQLVKARAAPSPVDVFCNQAYFGNTTKFCAENATPCSGKCMTVFQARLNSLD